MRKKRYIVKRITLNLAKVEVEKLEAYIKATDKSTTEIICDLIMTLPVD